MFSEFLVSFSFESELVKIWLRRRIKTRCMNAAASNDILPVFKQLHLMDTLLLFYKKLVISRLFCVFGCSIEGEYFDSLRRERHIFSQDLCNIDT